MTFKLFRYFGIYLFCLSIRFYLLLFVFVSFILICHLPRFVYTFLLQYSDPFCFALLYICNNQHYYNKLYRYSALDIFCVLLNLLVDSTRLNHLKRQKFVIKHVCVCILLSVGCT